MHATLAEMPFEVERQIASIAAHGLTDEEFRRLQSLGFLPGESVMKIHGGGFGKSDPLAIRIGRTTIALRRRYAAAVLIADSLAS